MAQSREQARLAERRRQERRAARQAESLHQRKVRSVIGAVVAIALLIGGVVWISIAKSNNNSITPGTATSDSASPTDTSGTAAASGSPSTTAPVGVACGGTVPTAAAPQTFKAEPPMTVNTKAKYVATLKTSCGTIDIVMDAAKTPHTVNSWAFLAAKGYWDGTRCHRMTSGTLNVLQCGDPTGSGSGNLGYTIPDENLTGATYPKGSVAMANTGSPHTGGGQFFINYADSQLPAQYTVVGQVTPATLAVLDKIKAVGIAGGATDGAPAQDIFLDKVTVAKQP